MGLPEGYNESALCKILEKAKADIEKEYGAVMITDHLKDKLLDYARSVAKSYNSQVAYEEIRRGIINFIKNGKKV